MSWWAFLNTFLLPQAIVAAKKPLISMSSFVSKEWGI